MEMILSTVFQLKRGKKWLKKLLTQLNWYKYDNERRWFTICKADPRFRG